MGYAGRCNYHKHIHTGEGGIIVTNNDDLADRVRLIRNHGEDVSYQRGIKSSPQVANIIGFNFRMTELEASIAREQLKKLDGLIHARLENIDYLSERLSGIPALIPPKVRPDCMHVYHRYSYRFDSEKAGISRDRFLDAVRAELRPETMDYPVDISKGVYPLYLQPMFQHQIGYGEKGCPFSCPWYGKKPVFEKGICPVAENMYFNEMISHKLMLPGFTRGDLDDVIESFLKVWENRKELY